MTMLSRFAATGGGGDPYWTSVSYLLVGNGVNGTTTNIKDSSSNNFTTTLVGTPVISTAQSKYGSGSVQFNGGSTGLTVPYNSKFSATNNFTLEFWMYSSNYGGVQVAASLSGGSTTSWWMEPTSNNMIFYVTVGGSYYTVTSSACPTNQWVFFAGVINNGVVYLYMNGISQGTPRTLPGNPDSGSGSLLYIGNYTGSFPIVGYLYDLRITAGVARYTSNFTPPTAPLPIG